MKKIEIRPNGTRRVYTENTQKSLTDPSFAKDTDVNLVVNKYIKTGQLPLNGPGMFADVSEIPDLPQALQAMNNAQELFNNLPDKVKKRFGNSPNELVNFMLDASNSQEAIQLGLLKLPAPQPLPKDVKKPKSKTPPKVTNDDESNDDET